MSQARRSRAPGALSLLCLSLTLVLGNVQAVEVAPKALSSQLASMSAKANAFFETAFQEEVDDSPMWQGYLGIKKDYGRWDDVSEAAALRDKQRAERQLAELEKTVNYQALDEQTRVSYELFKYNAEQRIEGYRWRLHNYPMNQMFGWQSTVPAFLINVHQIADRKDAEAYIQRLQGVKPLFDQLLEGMRLRESKGILPPKFVFAHVLKDSRNLLKGAPFEAGGDSTLLADFKDKLGKLKLSEAERKALTAEAEKALRESVAPAYQALIDLAETQEQRATTDDGAWKFPDGGAYYNYALRQTTTTELTAEEIHRIGLKEVARIHDEMRAIMKQVGFTGDLQDFFKFMREDPRFYYPNTAEGKAAYLAEATKLIATMKSTLDRLFIVKPKADLEVKAVEAFREESAGKAFYEQPAVDGSRPGRYYANLHDMADMPKYQMEALAYHEGIPGHHMQIAISMELENVPKFRKYGDYTAYVEGWALYTELLPKEIGFYRDPYSDFGRLAMELWRACRLVVDTGIHAKRWSRSQAIDYLKANTPNSEGDIVNGIERYIVAPSQATAYKIGMLKIQELRAKAEQALGKKFDLRAFHDVILKSGALPLAVLETQVDRWVLSQRIGG
ncbi:MAG: DUF885 domain-containing protein [Gammaproteobacteria bacterium]|nr:DUF885 domain-containing protein [Gammaproteobacteria bacterium]